jgi:hypothetical protein
MFRQLLNLMGRLAPFHLLRLADPRAMPGKQPLDGNMQSEWTKPREYSFTNADGEVFHEIAYSRQDVNTFAKMRKATSYKPTEDGSTRISPVADDASLRSKTIGRQGDND